MRTMHRFILITLLVAFIDGPAIAQAPSPARPQAGLSAVIADDDRLLIELSRRELNALAEFMFQKRGIGPERQAAIKAVGALKRLSGPSLALRQKAELVQEVAARIDLVLPLMKDPAELTQLAARLVEHGTKGGLNLLEYWGEDPTLQAQVRPIADAAARTYERAIALGDARRTEIESRMTTASLQTQLAPEWEKAARVVMTSRFNAPYNLYTLALSMDKADPRRQELCRRGIDLMKEFEDPQYEVVPAATLCIAKLHMASRTPDGIREARKRFAAIVKEPSAAWAQKFEATYFAAVAALLEPDLDTARREMNAVGDWLAKNPAPDAMLQRGTDAAMKMLAFRIHSAEAETAAGGAARAANDRAIAVLQALLTDRPDLEAIINQQLIARLPEDPDVTRLNAMLLKAICGRGQEELTKAPATANPKTLTLALSASREIGRRAGRDGITPADASRALLQSGLFCEKLGMDLDAAGIFLKYAETRRADLKLANDVLDNAAVAIGRLLKAHADSPGDAASRAVQDLYARFLDLATAEPFNRREFNFEYGLLLLKKNASLMEGDYASLKPRMLADARKAVALFQRVDGAKLRLPARSFEMASLDQALDLTDDAAFAEDCIRRIAALAGEINQIVAAELPRADDAARRDLRLARVRATLLLARLADHQRGPARAASLERAVAVLASFEQDVQGLENASALLGEALLMRLRALMELKRTEEALKDLGRFLENRSDEQGLDVVRKMLDNLGAELEQAQHAKDESRVAELAGHRARVSRYLVDRAAASPNAQTRQLLPRYQLFQASALQKAAELEKDISRRRAYLADALAIYETALRQSPDDRLLQLNKAVVQCDMGDYAAAQPVLAELLNRHLLGKPMLVDPADGTPRPNHAYWNGMLRLLRANVALVKSGAAGFDAGVLDETRRALKQLYIVWGEPGGPRWANQYEALRREVLPDWTPPTIDAPPQTQPAR